MKIQAFDPLPTFPSLPPVVVGARSAAIHGFLFRLDDPDLAVSTWPDGALQVGTQILSPTDKIRPAALHEINAAILAAIDGAILPGEAVSLTDEGDLRYASDRDLRGVVLARYGLASTTQAPVVEVQIERAEIPGFAETVREAICQIFREALEKAGEEPR